MLGLGIVEMMLTFSEQQRVVVILNADDLPRTPALLDESGIRADWFDGGDEDTAKLRVLAERNTPQSDVDAEQGSEAIASETVVAARKARRGEKSDRYWGVCTRVQLLHLTQLSVRRHVQGLVLRTGTV